MTDQYSGALVEEPRLAQSTMTERLQRKKAQLEGELTRVNAALEALEGNPEVARVVDAISELGHF
jgi:hypothetical protein